MRKRALALDRFTVVSDKKLFPFIVVRISEMADIGMRRQVIPCFYTLPDFFPRHDAAFFGSRQSFKNAARLETQHHRIAKVACFPLLVSWGIAEDENRLSWNVKSHK